MTKSVKEKIRLTKIKDLLEKGLPVTADLIKIKMAYRVTGNYQKATNSKLPFCTSEDIRSYIDNSLKQTIPTLIANVANSIKQYKLKILFETQIHVFEKGRNTIFFCMYAFRKKGKPIRLSFTFLNDDYVNFDNYMIDYDSSSFDNKSHEIENKTLLKLCLDEVTYMIKEHVFVSYRAVLRLNNKIKIQNKIPNKNDKKEILNFLKFQKIILKSVFGEDEVFYIDLIYSNKVEIIFLTYYELASPPLIFPSLIVEMKKFSNFDFLKILVDLKIIKSGITEDDFNQASIENIINVLKIENY